MSDATQSFFERLSARAREVDSLLCIGLDPHPSDLAAPTAQAALQHGLRLVEATSDLALAYKPNAAFFEAFGAAGVDALARLIAAVPSAIPVILDAKRGDIGSTSAAYAVAAFDALGADALTVSPYLGEDAVAPFMAAADKGVFLLCKTSNPGSEDLQDLPLAGEGEPVFARVAALARRWNRRDNVGLVVGATHPSALARVRQACPDQWILAPGVGAQGGNLEQALSAGLRADGLGLIVTVSRGISRAEDPRRAAAELRDTIARARAAARGASATPEAVTGLAHGHLADALLDTGCVRFGEFTLKSGLQSPIYIDLRRLIADPGLMVEVARAYAELLRGLRFEQLAALPYAALPIGTAVSLEGGWPLVYPRREAKSYGTRAVVEGVFQQGDTAVVIDDLATTGGSKIEAIAKLRAAGLVCRDVVVLIDRESGASEMLSEAGFEFHSVFTLSDLTAHWHASGRINADQRTEVERFIQASRA